MSRPSTPEIITDPPSAWGPMFRRALLRRCPRCGSGGQFLGYWRLRDRCTGCGIRFVREEGYFTGVYLVNFAAVLVVLFVMIMAFAIWWGREGEAPLVPALIVGGVVAVVLPVVLYPWARTVWAAMDMIMSAPDEQEAAEAAAAVAADEDGPTGG